MTTLRRPILIAIAGLLQVAVHPLLARELEAPRDNPAYVDVSINAERRIENAQALEASGRVREAVLQYLEVRRDYPDCLHAAQGVPGLYLLYEPIRRFVDRHLLNLPQDLRREVAQRLDPQARPRLEALFAAPSIEGLEEFLDAFELSSHGPAARRLLGDICLESGDLEGALRAWEPLLDRPGKAPAPNLVRRLGIVYFRQGRRSAIQGLIRRDMPGSQRLVPLASACSVPKPQRVDSGALLPGYTRFRALWHCPVMGAHLPRDEKDRPRGETVSGMSLYAGSPAFQPLSMVADGDRIWLNLVTTPHLAWQAPPCDPYGAPQALDGFTGKAVSQLFLEKPPKPRTPRPTPPFGRFAFPVHPDLFRSRYGMVCSGGAVYAIEPDLTLSTRKKEDDPAPLAWRLVRWARSDRGPIASLRRDWTWAPPGALTVPGLAPTVSDGRIYVTYIRVQEETKHLHQYVACLDADTGKECWKTFLSAFNGSGSFSRSGRDLDVPPPSAPLVAGDRLYVVTNMGTVASLDCGRGILRWVFKYAIDAEKNRVWFPSTPLVHQGVLIAAPVDHPSLFALEPATGQLLWSHMGLFRFERNVFDNTASQPDTRYRDLIGARDGLVVFASLTRVYAFDAAQGVFVWDHDLNEEISGAGLLARDKVLVPTVTGVVVLDLATGRRAGGRGKTYLLRWSALGPVYQKHATIAGEFRPGGDLAWLQVERVYCLREGKDGVACPGRLKKNEDGTYICPECGATHRRGTRELLVVGNRLVVSAILLVADEERGR